MTKRLTTEDVCNAYCDAWDGKGLDPEAKAQADLLLERYVQQRISKKDTPSSSKRK